MRIFLNLVIIVSCLFYCEAGKRKAQGKTTYELNWVGAFKGCEGFDNEAIDATKMSIEKDTPTSTAMSGDMIFEKAMEDETELVVTIEKETSQGKVIAYTLEVKNLCDNVGDKGMPWSIFFEAMNVTACPIPAATYPMVDLKLSMGFLDGALNHETLGEYLAKIELRQKGEGLDVIEHDVACYLIGFTVDEVRESS